jgi:hypothetical protein
MPNKITKDTIEEVYKFSIPSTDPRTSGINLSASNEDEEPWRINRLYRVMDFVSKNCDDINLLSLHDHKGALSVSWNKEPSVFEKQLAEIAWERENELKENVMHTFEKKTGGNIMYKTLGVKWLFETSCPASAFVTADRDEARNPQRFIHVSVKQTNTKNKVYKDKALLSGQIAKSNYNYLIRIL